MNSTYYAGVMTGTSLDAADAVLVDFNDNGCHIIAHAQVSISPALASEWRTLTTNDALLARAMDAANDIARLCAQAVAKINASPNNIAAVGCHGQTVLHRPSRGWSAQLLNGALLAELCGTDVVCDFRARDIAAGGQGAPLAPLFHRAIFAAHRPCAVVNLGGIANISVLDNNDNLYGWDTGPANMLMDAWHQRHQDGTFDGNGNWAASGTVVTTLLQTLLAHSFLALPPPKSCGREEFDLRLFEDQLTQYPPQDAQATLLEWSAQTIADAVKKSGVPTLFLCGGGTHNTALVSRLTALLANCQVRLTDTIGLPAEQVEAAAFAWLAKQFMDGRTTAASTVTGAHGARILGAHYPR